MRYFVYIVRCEDNSLYTGISTDVSRRFCEHCSSPLGAKYTRLKKAIKIERVWQTEGRSNASKLEYRIKSLSKQQKEILILDNSYFEKFFHMLDLSNYTLLGDLK